MKIQNLSCMNLLTETVFKQEGFMNWTTKNLELKTKNCFYKGGRDERD